MPNGDPRAFFYPTLTRIMDSFLAHHCFIFFILLLLFFYYLFYNTLQEVPEYAKIQFNIALT